MKKDAMLFLFLFGIVMGKEGRISKIVNITQGPVRGYRDPAGVFVFYSIPYATAPIGPHKFKAPLPPPDWLEPFEAVDKKIVCPQIILTPPTYYSPYMVQQEDCLIANIFTPDNEQVNLSVVVYIHGGSFSNHFGNVLTPKNYVRRSNIIVVTINYRQGLHGFLCLGTQDIPGNAGLKDQVAALRWVKENIAAFGGNPNDVTLAGYSSGGALVDIIALSPAANGLFNKVILDSANSLIISAVVNDPLENAINFAVQLGFDAPGNVSALEKFYKTTPLEVLLREELREHFSRRYDLTYPFTPCIERDTEEQAIKIITEPPQEIIKKRANKQVPMLYGFTNMEGFKFSLCFEHYKNAMNERFSNFIPGNLKFENYEQKEILSNRIMDLYFGGELVNAGNMLNYITYLSDMLVNYHGFRAVKMHLEAGHDKIFLYEYTFVDDDVPVVPQTNIRGADHVAQTFAIFDAKIYDFRSVPSENNITDEYKELKKTVRDFWANFIKTGTPVPAGSDLPAWPPVGDASLTPHMEITLPPRLRWQWDEQWLRRMRFWDSIYELHYRAPVPPQNPNPSLDRSLLDTSQYKIIFKVVFKLFTVIYYAVMTFTALLNFIGYFLS